MSTKTEERVKNIMKEYIEERQSLLDKAIIEKALGIFLAGTVAGVLLAYTNIAPLSIGLIAGYAIAKRNMPIIDHYLLSFIQKSTSFLDSKMGIASREKGEN